MTYIYDILLNFNEHFFEFYEWEKGDYLTLIKKIPIYKVNSTFLEDILKNKIKIDDPIMYELLNKCEVIQNKKIKIIKQACLFTDGYKVIAVLFSNNQISKISDLLLDEASDIISLSTGYQQRDIAYNIIGTKKNCNFLTRREIKIEKYLKEEINKAYLSDEIKLKYLYFEYFNKNVLDLEIAYKELIESFEKGITDNHMKLYELLRLSHNLTK